jgi:AraC-like DNA-binding protein
MNNSFIIALPAFIYTIFTLEMRLKVPIQLVLCLLYFVRTDALETGRPPIALTYPRPYTVIGQNGVKIHAAMNIPNDSILKLLIYAHYATYGSWRAHRQNTHLLAELKGIPFEYVWDCSKVPDQGFWWAAITVEGHLKNGQIVKARSPICFDRNKYFSSKTIKSGFTKDSLKLDGTLNDWEKADTLHFRNQDDRVYGFSCWNNNALYFAFVVEDNNIVNTVSKKEVSKIYRQDGIGITLDPQLTRASLPEPSHRFLRFAANALQYCEQVYVDSAKQLVVNHIKNNIEFYVKLGGTLNQSSDTDTGYTLEIKIPWRDLGKNYPSSSDSLGLNVIFTNTNHPEKEGFYASWADLPVINSSNPSEWGTLVLIKPAPYAVYTLLIIFFTITAAISTLCFIKRSKDRESGIRPTPASQFYNTVKTYIENHFNENGLNMETIASATGFKKDYFRQKFKKEFGINFPDYLNRFRLEKAKEILKTGDLPILDVALLVGFNSHENFNRLFKKTFGQPPSDWRRSQKSS